MPVARLATYKLRPGALDRIVDHARRELYPKFDNVDGVLTYEIVKGEGDTLISFATCQDRKAADAVARLAADWVKKNMRDDIVNATFHVGEIAVSGGARAPA